MNPGKRFYLRIDGVDGDELGDHADYLSQNVFASLLKTDLYPDLHGVVPVRNPEYDPRLPGPGDVTVVADALAVVLELADARLDDDLHDVRSGMDPERIGYDEYTTGDANDAINALRNELRFTADDVDVGTLEQ